MDEGVDSGDIWRQEEFEISLENDAATGYEKIKE